jgi:hypothetical protein
MSPEAWGERPSPSVEREPQMVRSTVKSVGEAMARNGRVYKVLEFDNGEKFPVWDAKKLEGLVPGAEIGYLKARNEKTGYWNLTELRRLEPEAAEKQDVASDDLTKERGSERWTERDRDLLSVNALTSATTLITSMLPYLEEKPTRLFQAIDLVKQTHAALMKIHHGEGNTQPNH